MNNAKSRNGCIIGGIFCFLLVLVIVLIWSSFKFFNVGPRYNGKSLRQWTEAMDSLDSYTRTQAMKSVRAIGTNAIPTLINWMAHRDSKSEREFYEQVKSQKALMQFWPVLMKNSEAHFEYNALLGFYALGESAQAALPFLERIICTDDVGNPAKSANAAMAYVSVSRTEAGRIVKLWRLNTNPNMIRAANRLKGALVRTENSASNSPASVEKNVPLDKRINNTDGTGVKGSK